MSHVVTLFGLVRTATRPTPREFEARAAAHHVEHEATTSAMTPKMICGHGRFAPVSKASGAEGLDELDDGRTEGDDVERREQTEHQRKHQLDADLRRPLLGALPPLGARHLGVRAQRLRDAGAEPVGLHQHRHQRPHVVHLRARREVLERLEPRLAGAAFDVDQPQLLGQLGIGDRQLLGALENRLVERRARPRGRRSAGRARRAGRSGSPSALRDAPIEHEPGREVADDRRQHGEDEPAALPDEEERQHDAERRRAPSCASDVDQRCASACGSRPASSRRCSVPMSFGDFGMNVVTASIERVVGRPPSALRRERRPPTLADQRVEPAPRRRRALEHRRRRSTRRTEPTEMKTATSVSDEGQCP